MNKTETLCYKYLVKQGFLVEKPVKTRWQSVDFFNTFDFICAKNGWFRFIQVSVKYFSQRDREWQNRFNEFPLATGMSKEYWRISRKLPQLFIISVSKSGRKEFTEYYELPK
jgi:hypothetical protein